MHIPVGLVASALLVMLGGTLFLWARIRVEYLRWAPVHEDAAIALAELRVFVFVSMGITALLLIGIFMLYVLRIRIPLQSIHNAIEQMLAGSLDSRATGPDMGDSGRALRSVNRLLDKYGKLAWKRARDRDRLGTVTKVMTDGILILNKNGKIRLLNPAALQLLNATEEKTLRRSFIQVVRDHRIADVWIRCRNRGSQEIATLDLGTERFLRVIASPFQSDADDAPADRSYLVIIQDLSEVRRLQTVRQDFVSNISHELRTPLASLRALADTLRYGALEDPPAAHRFLNRIDVEVDNLTQMVEELLDLSRIESGKVSLNIESVSISAIIEPVVERLRPQADRAQVHLAVDVIDDTLKVLVDVDQVEHVIINLVHNAIKFTPAGGRIVVSAQSIGQYMRVSVADTGCGIPPGQLPRIFERFYKVDRSRAGGGTGLGLAIARHVVRTHGGEIWVESDLGEGSTFFFTLPQLETNAGTPETAHLVSLSVPVSSPDSAN